MARIGHMRVSTG